MPALATRCAALLDEGLEAQAQQFVLWIPVALGVGIAAWFLLSGPPGWWSALCLFAMIGFAGVAIGGRAGWLIGSFGLLAAIGLALIWSRAEWVAAPRIDRPVTAEVIGRVERIEQLAGRGQVRVTLVDEAAHAGLRLRVSFVAAQAAGVESGMAIGFRARLMPPAAPAIPGGYDFARLAWFKGIGATGRPLGPPRIIGASDAGGVWVMLDRVRGRLTRHVQQQVGGGAGGIAASLVTGDQGGVPEDVAQALRDSGLAHLLSISGLHIAAAVGFVMLVTRRFLALSMRAAIHWPLTLIGASAGALAGIAYSLLAGGEVPTVRSCIAALLVLAGLAMGREAITLRIVAAGAVLILLFRPEALVGPSFQLSFAAVAAIVALHELPWLRERLMRREEPWWAAALRAVMGLLLTGLVVETALAPIGLFHFNRMGVYGAFANIIAIPLTTFVIMPLEALALLFDPLGLSAPFYTMLKWALGGLILLARSVAAAPGGVALAPVMPQGAFGLMVLGGLWLCLWRGRVRLWGLAPAAIGAIWAMAAPPADLWITGDGRHIGIRTPQGAMLLLRPRTGDYVRSLLGDAAAVRSSGLIEADPLARCSADACVADLWRDGRRTRVLATRSRDLIDRAQFEPACKTADIVVSERRLPFWCNPRQLKADRIFLERNGGLAIWTGAGKVRSVRQATGRHPWAVTP